MAINFPTYIELPLENSPIKEVICQVRFAPLLEIAQKLPSDFHKYIRRKFPQFEVTQNVGIDIAQPLPSEYTFKSPNNQSRVTLSVNFVGITTKEYSHWSKFKNDIKIALEGLKKSYDTVFVSRIGLRYVNELNTKNTHLDTIDEMLEIVNGDLTHLSLNDTWSLPKKTIHLLSLGDGNNELTIRFAFEQSPTNPTVLLDFDYFTSFDVPLNMETNEILEKIEIFHKGCYDAFRWSIREDRLEAFGVRKGK